MIRLFLADDMAAVREVIRAGLLAEPGRFRVVGEAADGMVALNAIAALAPDVAILDVDMPGLTGLEVVYRLRQQGNGTPVVLCTGSEADLPAELPAGVACLAKPFRLERLVEVVDLYGRADGGIPATAPESPPGWSTRSGAPAPQPNSPAPQVACRGAG